jgi:hypothetical protein
MEGMNDEGQWIILMAFLVCVGLFFLSVVINESTTVGRTTAESVLDFSKSDIQDLRDQVFEWKNRGLNSSELLNSSTDLSKLAMYRQNARVNITSDLNKINIHYNNGVTEYDEKIFLP